MTVDLVPKIDIVLSNGVFLPRGFRVKAEIADQLEYDFILPYVNLVRQIDDNRQETEKQPVQEEAVLAVEPVVEKPKRGRKPSVKNELD